MTRSLFIIGTALILGASLPCRAAGFEFEVAAPKFRVSIPGIPQIVMAVHPMNAAQPHFRYQGSEAPFTVSVFTPAAASGMTPRECASATLRSMTGRPGVPPAAQLYKAQLNDTTFVVIYAAKFVAGVQLNAHLLSAAGGTHCVEVHVTKASMLTEDLATWIDEFEKARIAPN